MYWNTTVDEYETKAKPLKRGQLLDKYPDRILYWLKARSAI
jgi:hypothetical protein